jgi:hypothetical protein
VFRWRFVLQRAREACIEVDVREVEHPPVTTLWFWSSETRQTQWQGCRLVLQKKLQVEEKGEYVADTVASLLKNQPSDNHRRGDSGGASTLLHGTSWKPI